MRPLSSVPYFFMDGCPNRHVEPVVVEVNVGVRLDFDPERAHEGLLPHIGQVFVEQDRDLLQVDRWDDGLPHAVILDACGLQLSRQVIAVSLLHYLRRL